jgi:hypothetical protein
LPRAGHSRAHTGIAGDKPLISVRAAVKVPFPHLSEPA